MQLLGQFLDFDAVGIRLFVESLLEHLVFFGPFGMLAPLSFHLLVGLFEFLHVLLSRLFVLLLALFLLFVHFALQEFIFFEEQLMIGPQFVHLIGLLDYLHIQCLYLLRVVQLQLIDHLHAYDVCVVHSQVRIDASQLLVLYGE